MGVCSGRSHNCLPPAAVPASSHAHEWSRATSSAAPLVLSWSSASVPTTPPCRRGAGGSVRRCTIGGGGVTGARVARGSHTPRRTRGGEVRPGRRARQSLAKARRGCPRRAPTHGTGSSSASQCRTRCTVRAWPAPSPALCGAAAADAARTRSRLRWGGAEVSG